MKKQITMDYNEYLEMEQKIRELIDILIRVRFKENITNNIKEDIDELNRVYGFWI